MQNNGQIFYSFPTGLPSAMGALRLCSDGVALTHIDFAGELPIERPPHGAEPASWQRRDDLPILQQAATELRQYFAGQRREFTVALALAGTPFQRRVWDELCRIPYAQTWSYVELARRIDNPQASRAVGSANGKNPIPIIVPCHRVIGASGQLTGYGGGLPRKQLLLELEQSPRLPGIPADLAPVAAAG